MKSNIRWLKIGGWMLIFMVSIFVLAKTSFGYFSGLPVGEAVKNAIMDILDFDTREDISTVVVFVLGVGCLVKARRMSKALDREDTSQ